MRLCFAPLHSVFTALLLSVSVYVFEAAVSTLLKFFFLRISEFSLVGRAISTILGVMGRLDYSHGEEKQSLFLLQQPPLNLL